MPRDASLLADCWAYARRAFHALELAGVVERAAKAWLRRATLSFAVWSWDLSDLGGPGRLPPTFVGDDGTKLPRAPPLSVRAAKRSLRAGDATATATDRRFSTRNAATSPFERVAVDRALDGLAAEACALAFECAFAPVRSALRRVSASRLRVGVDTDASLPFYCRAATWCGSGPRAAGSDDLPSPSDYVTVVGEHLMSALRHLEPFLESDAVVDANAVQVDAAHRLTDQKEWAALGDVLQLNDGDRLGLRALGSGAPVDGATLPRPSAGATPRLRPDDDADTDPAARFCSEWLHVLVKATVAALLDELLRVPAVDARGFEQLNADATYLLNVSKALAVPQHSVLLHVVVVADAAVQGSNHLAQLRQRHLPQVPAANVLRRIEATFQAKLDAAAQ